MREQRDVDLVQHGRRQAVLADGDDRMQAMGLGAERAALGGCQGFHRASLTSTAAERRRRSRADRDAYAFPDVTVDRGGRVRAGAAMHRHARPADRTTAGERTWRKAHEEAPVRQGVDAGARQRPLGQGGDSGSATGRARRSS